jgi:hypothetical protein
MEEINISQIEIDGKHYNFKQFDANENNFTMIVDARSRHLDYLLGKFSTIKILKTTYHVFFTQIKGPENIAAFKVVIDPEWIKATAGWLTYPNWCDTEEKREKFYNMHSSYEETNSDIYITGDVIRYEERV